MSIQSSVNAMLGSIAGGAYLIGTAGENNATQPKAPPPSAPQVARMREEAAARMRLADAQNVKRRQSKTVEEQKNRIKEWTSNNPLADLYKEWGTIQ